MKNIKKAIEILERNENRFLLKEGGAYIEIRNVSKDDDFYYADVTLGNDITRTVTTHENCEYDKKIINKIIKQF